MFYYMIGVYFVIGIISASRLVSFQFVKNEKDLIPFIHTRNFYYDSFVAIIFNYILYQGGMYDQLNLFDYFYIGLQIIFLIASAKFHGKPLSTDVNKKIALKEGKDMQGYIFVYNIMFWLFFILYVSGFSYMYMLSGFN